jgi:C-terminal processing protease CtpA/Prc
MFVSAAAQAQTQTQAQIQAQPQAQPQTQTNLQRKTLTAVRPCANDQIDLGFDNVVCQSCTVSGKHVAGEPDIEFATEPTISGIRKGGPADGKLEERDVLVAIDGQLITTRAAAIRYSWLTAGTPVRLTVRRNGVVKDVEITPATNCDPLFRRSARVQGSSYLTELRFQRRDLTINVPAKSRGWIGVGLSCPTCGASLGLQVTTPFRAYPEIAEVTADSPAAKAGIKVGDVILAIDGVSITSTEGSTLFRDVKPNQKVKILLIRNAEVITVTLTAAAPR